jgi:hypothetical protein
LNFLSAAIEKRERKQTTIVFDAGGAPPGLPRMIMHDGITVHFAPRHSDADEMIEDLLEKHRSPKSLLVVSSDHRVQRAARHRGAKFIDSEKWYAERVAILRRRATADDAVAKPRGNPTPDEVGHWLKEFGDGENRSEPSNSPFPPGYADDVADE